MPSSAPQAESTWIAAGAAQDLPPGGRKLVFVPGREAVLLLNVEGAFFALENSCPHAGASMASGSCEGQVLSCPAHGLKFHLATGRCTASPQLHIPVYAVVQQGDRLWLQPPGTQASGATPVPSPSSF